MTKSDRILIILGGTHTAFFDHFLKNNPKFINSIKSLHAHALLNAGHLSDGELILKELLSTWLINKNDFESYSFFDVLDRLSAIYIKYNCFEFTNNIVDFILSKYKNNLILEHEL